MAGSYIKHRKTKSSIEFLCTNAKIRVDICADDILRIRMRPDGEFKPDETFVVIRYDWPVTSYNIKDNGDYIAIETQRMQIKAFKSPFRFEFFDLNGKPVNRDWKEGSMGFRGNEIICKKELTGSDHFFGLGQRYEKSDLRGMKATCLVTREYTPVPFFLGTDGYGIFFHNTWTSTFDFTQDPYSFSAPGGEELDYYFIYGPGFKHIIQQYSKITGLSPLPPKWAFGLFFSRWDEEVEGIKYRQDGQQGMLRTIKSVREIWDWPLDGIRVHSMGPKQSFYASPDLSWPDMLWGEFPAVDSFVLKLHEQHIHPLFWEAPGITGNCKMYDEAIQNNYFLMKDGKPQNIVFGYLQPPGGMVDFMNPEARKWWGRYHYYMADFGSDGVAGDWNDEKMLRGTNDNQHYVDEIRSPLTIQIYPEGKSSFELYEDDGESYDYERGIFSITTYSCTDLGKELLIKKSAPVGKYNIPEKEIVYCIHLKTGAKEVFHDQRSLPLCRSEEEFNSQKEGWMQESGGKKLLWFKVNLNAADKMEVKVSF